MTVLVGCRQLDLRQPRGLENFAAAVVEGFAQRFRSVVLDVCETSRATYQSQFGRNHHIAIVADPVQGWCCRLAEAGRAGKIFGHLGYNLKKVCGLDLFARRMSWAAQQKADVVYYPSHRDAPQHHHLPMVSTVHAILPEYSGREIAVLERHLQEARAVVTSWPHPFKDLRTRYPYIADKLFLVPFSGLDTEATPIDEVLAKFHIAQPFYFYPAGVFARKNHINLIRACEILRKNGRTVPTIICTGGGDVVLQSQLE